MRCYCTVRTSVLRSHYVVVLAAVLALAADARRLRDDVVVVRVVAAVGVAVAVPAPVFQPAFDREVSLELPIDHREVRHADRGRDAQPDGQPPPQPGESHPRDEAQQPAGGKAQDPEPQKIPLHHRELLAHPAKDAAGGALSVCAYKECPAVGQKEK
eukprot:31445-Pelagococcus_subviridis.AAC.22